MLSALLISNSYELFLGPAQPEAITLTLIHLQDVDGVADLQGEFHILRRVVVIDGCEREERGLETTLLETAHS